MVFILKYDWGHQISHDSTIPTKLTTSYRMPFIAGGSEGSRKLISIYFKIQYLPNTHALFGNFLAILFTEHWKQDLSFLIQSAPSPPHPASTENVKYNIIANLPLKYVVNKMLKESYKHKYLKLMLKAYLFP